MDPYIQVIDFLIIGAAKAGTSWLADMLSQHPDIFLPWQKELNYFNEVESEDENRRNLNRDFGEDWYHQFFLRSKPEQIKGEASTSYLSDQGAPYNIFKYNPKVKIIALLRHPIERTFSHFLFFKQLGIIAPNDRLINAINKHKSVIERSYYSQSLIRYLDLFPRDNILIIYFEEIQKDNKQVIKKAETFLGVKEFIPENYNMPRNVTGIPRAKWFGLHFRRNLAALFYRINDVFGLFSTEGLSNLALKYALIFNKRYNEKPIIDDESQAFLSVEFAEEIIRLEELLGVDLSHWKKDGVIS